MLGLVKFVHCNGEIMLQIATEALICTLSQASGRNVLTLDMARFQAGSIIQITTESGSVYLLETINEHSHWIHFTRYTHKDSRQSGQYFGRQRLDSCTIEIGKAFSHDGMLTKPIVKIAILCE